jgi:osmotically-inducible protein OsmY
MAKRHPPKASALYDGMPSATTPAAHPVERGHRGRGPQGYVRPDPSIADDIARRLTDDEHIDASEILLQVEDGVATLTGNVPRRAMKHRAEDIAADASGVREVRNRIRVDDGSASAGPPGKAVRSGPSNDTNRH